MTNTQGFMHCGKWLNAPKDGDGYVYCRICGKDGKNRKREYQER